MLSLYKVFYDNSGRVLFCRSTKHYDAQIRIIRLSQQEMIKNVFFERSLYCYSRFNVFENAKDLEGILKV